MAEQEKDEKKSGADWQFERLPNGNLTGKLEHGIQVGEDRLHTFEVRPATAADMFDAENDAPVTNYLAYRGALIGRQLVRLGDIGGPIGFDLIGKLKPKDYGQLVDALDEVEVPGKPSSTDSKDSTNASSSSA